MPDPTTTLPASEGTGAPQAPAADTATAEADATSTTTPAKPAPKRGDDPFVRGRTSAEKALSRSLLERFGVDSLDALEARLRPPPDEDEPDAAPAKQVPDVRALRRELRTQTDAASAAAARAAASQKALDAMRERTVSSMLAAELERQGALYAEDEATLLRRRLRIDDDGEPEVVDASGQATGADIAGLVREWRDLRPGRFKPTAQPGAGSRPTTQASGATAPAAIPPANTRAGVAARLAAKGL